VNWLSFKVLLKYSWIGAFNFEWFLFVAAASVDAAASLRLMLAV
jgi:hypothetical protein